MDQVLESAAEAVTAQAVTADDPLDECLPAGFPADHAITVFAKMLRLELIQVKAADREGIRDVLTRLQVLGPQRAMGVRARGQAGHWPQQEPAPHGEPVAWDPSF
jgi:hypothetical protein